jgi:chaperone required for assembly of F1-ATPase
MRDWFDDIGRGSPLDPREAVRRGTRRELPKRFYQQAGVAERAGTFAVELDGKPVVTPAKRALTLPTRALAEAVAAEWQAQGERIDPGAMPLTRLAHTAIDRVAAEPEAVRAEILKYAGGDLLFYRATEPDGLVSAQAAHWDPVLEWAAVAFGARFAPVQGVRFAQQPMEAIGAVRSEIARYREPFALAALASLTNLAGSALLALALAAGRLDTDAAWAAAHVDEDWNVKRWGEDAEAAARRAARFQEFKAAAQMLAFTPR